MTDQNLRDLLDEGKFIELLIYCYLVQRGKPASKIGIRRNISDKVTRWIQECYELQVLIDDPATYISANTLEELALEDTVFLWIFKYPHLKNVIEFVMEQPEGQIKEWLQGKLFGYSEEAIQEYLSQQNPTKKY